MRRFTVITGAPSSIRSFALNVIQTPSRCQMRPPAVKRFRRGRSASTSAIARSTRWKSVTGRAASRARLRSAAKASAASTSTSCSK
jgi:hypothetical protein